MKNSTDAFAETASQGRRWLREISEALGGSLDDDTALCSLRGTLHALRDQLTVEQSAHLSAQLPTVIRGIYYEDWSPASVPVRDRHRERFLERVSRHLGGTNLRLDLADIVLAVLAVLDRHISEGESNKLYHVLASDIKALWPER